MVKTSTFKPCGRKACFRLILPAALLLAVPARALTLSPAVVTLSTAANQAQTFNVRVFNDSPQTIQVTPALQDWQYNAKGQKIFRPAGTLAFSLAPFLELNPAPFTLDPGKSRIVSLNAKVPASQLGGHHAMLFFRAVPYVSPLSGQHARVLIAIQLGVTLLQESKDALVLKSRITGFEAASGPQGTDVRLNVENQGNTWLDATGVVAVTDDKDHFIGSFKLPMRYVLRSQAGQLAAHWKQTLAPGNYRFLVTYQFRGQSTTIGRNLTIGKP